MSEPGGRLRLSEQIGYRMAVLAVSGATVVAVAAIIALIRSMRADDRRLVLGLGLVMGGALGNLVDRVRFRAVIGLSGFLHRRVALAGLQCGGRGHLSWRAAGLPVPLAASARGRTAQRNTSMTGTPVTFEWWYILVALLPMIPTFWSIWHI